MSAEFFSSIPGTTRFSGVVDEKNFYPVPDDWVIIITDIRSSTRAVAEGRYKDVNMIGGAAICAVKNATGFSDWPFVFGGDGATLLVDSACQADAEAALVRTRSLARDDFDLDLRIAFVPIRDIRERGRDVLVARYEVSPGNCLAMFGGGGVELADELVKDKLSATRYMVSDYTLPGLPDLTGLSCRWEPLCSRNGRIVCLMVKSQADDFKKRQAITSAFLDRLAELIGPEFSQASPVNARSLSLRWPPRGLQSEARATRAGKSYVRRLLELYAQSFLQWVLELSDLQAGNYNPEAYRAQIQTNSDFCKFDDVLRMVLDCTPEQIVGIRQLLDRMHVEGDIDFGIFETEKALMTCLLFDLASSQHLHFIDGDDGGFWSAAKEYKLQSSSNDHEPSDPPERGNSA